MTRFELISHWSIPAPRERVWAAIADPQGWPRWWPFVRSVHTLQAGAADGTGSVRRIRWATRLPYEIVIDVEAVEVVRPARLRGRSRGQLRGEGLWTLRADGPARTAVTYRWQVELAKPWMRWFAPLLAPVYRWNHDAVMRAGEIGLRRLLAEAGRSAGRAPTGTDCSAADRSAPGLEKMPGA